MLIKDRGTTSIQAMPFVEDFIDLDNTAGSIGNKVLVLCKIDGGITLTFASGAIKATTMAEGQSRALPVGCTVTIASGAFDFA